MREITAIASKSDAHRAMICAALSELTSGRKCKIHCEQSSKDIEATAACLLALLSGQEEMYCGESGSTLRFLLPVMGALGHAAAFYAEGRLPQRPLSPLYEELINHGCILSEPGSAPLTISGKLSAGIYTMPGNVSSQYISGLLLALPLLKGDSRIQLTGPMESRGYVDMTLQVIRKFGVQITETPEGFEIAGGQQYLAPEAYQVEGDWSNSCFFLAAGALVEGGICVKGLSADSLQGDRKILDLLRQFGAEVCERESDITVKPGKLRGITIDASQIPDMVPILAVLACAADGKTIIENAGRLRIKESDRLQAVSQGLNSLGAKVEELPEGLVIEGFGSGSECSGKPLRGGTVDGAGDHRIVMMAAIASLLCRQPVAITGAEAVSKSYPDFFADLKKLDLGGNVRI